MTRRWPLVVAVVVALAIVLVAWVRSLFHEPHARRIASLVDELHAHSIVAVFAHPDDEIKVCGLLGDAGARKDVVARVISVALGDGGIVSPEFPRADLPRVREAELRRHAALLGVRDVEVWPYRDGHVSAAPPGELEARIIARLRQWQPDVVLTFDPAGGFSAHPDHLRVGAATRAAFCAVAGDANPPRWLVYILAPRGAARVFGGARGRRVAAVEPAPQFAVHVAPEQQIRGWDTHRSQRDYIRRNTHVPAWLLFRLSDDELYAVFDRTQVCK
ncbi:MAG TPA: PIG-L family deacetylase [Polyangia bacterium]|jgi:LmbE family N-acetylglucosaminyl deacetylase|nr:PIG-L family deacetylase [Polyangia bacterium]